MYLVSASIDEILNMMADCKARHVENGLLKIKFSITKDSFKFLPTVELLIIYNNKLLIAYSKNKQAEYFRGGKVNDVETPMQSL